MASKRPLDTALRLWRAKPNTQPVKSYACRTFSANHRQLTDGVFRELTAARVQTPWIEAFRGKEKQEIAEEKSQQNTAPISGRDLTPKRMSDSYHAVILPLAQDPWLLDTYLNSSGHIRLGTLFMDLDALSGIIAYKHTGDNVTTVTAAFDRITINSPLKEICDLQLSGQVTYATGRSSMDISLQVAKAPAAGQEVKNEDILITCSCTMVSLDPQTKKPVSIPPLIIETTEEHKLFEIGERNNQSRKELGKHSLTKHSPNPEEMDLIHALWQQQQQWHDPNMPKNKPENVSWMQETVLRTANIMQPQYRNRHHFMIFGGYLLKQTFELAFCCAASFSHCRPTFVSLDPSTFQNPVPVGSVLYMSSTVTYCDTPSSGGSDQGKTRIQVKVDTKVRNVEHVDTKPTGQFNYTFVVDRDVKVMPKTYTEFMMYIDARRRAQRVAELVQGTEGVFMKGLTE